MNMSVRRLFGMAAMMAAIAFVAVPSAAAADASYEYHIEHPTYGGIGTYTNIVKDLGDHVEVVTQLRVAVKVLGIVMHREEADRTEIWRDGRLVQFDGTTDTNGTSIKLHGEAKGDRFVITTPFGIVTAPSNVHPSNPWSAKVLDTDAMMSTKSGRIDKVTVTGPVVGPVKFDGVELQLSRYDITGGKKQSVWLDDRGMPVAFRTIEEDTPVDFVLTRPSLSQAANSVKR
jgi:hypothetical protein